VNELVVVPDNKMPNLYRIKWSDGGDIAGYLSGLYSTRISAKKKIMFYEARPKPQPIKYKHQKAISNEEEAEMFEKVTKQVEAENNGKEEKPKGKNKN